LRAIRIHRLILESALMTIVSLFIPAPVLSFQSPSSNVSCTRTEATASLGKMLSGVGAQTRQLSSSMRGAVLSMAPQHLLSDELTLAYSPEPGSLRPGSGSGSASIPRLADYFLSGDSSKSSKKDPYPGISRYKDGGNYPPGLSADMEKKQPKDTSQSAKNFRNDGGSNYPPGAGPSSTKGKWF
jgi:hypothetical protein